MAIHCASSTSYSFSAAENDEASAGNVAPVLSGRYLHGDHFGNLQIPYAPASCTLKMLFDVHCVYFALQRMGITLTSDFHDFLRSQGQMYQYDPYYGGVMYGQQMVSFLWHRRCLVHWGTLIDDIKDNFGGIRV